MKHLETFSSWSNKTPPNTACSRQVGHCSFFKPFSGFELFPAPPGESQPAHLRLTPAVGPLAQKSGALEPGRWHKRNPPQHRLPEASSSVRACASEFPPAGSSSRLTAPNQRGISARLSRCDLFAGGTIEAGPAHARGYDPRHDVLGRPASISRNESDEQPNERMQPTSAFGRSSVHWHPPMAGGGM